MGHEWEANEEKEAFDICNVLHQVIGIMVVKSKCPAAYTAKDLPLTAFLRGEGKQLERFMPLVDQSSKASQKVPAADRLAFLNNLSPLKSFDAWRSTYTYTVPRSDGEMRKRTCFVSCSQRMQTLDHELIMTRRRPYQARVTEHFCQQ